MDESLPQQEIERRDEPPAIEGSASTRITYTLRFTGWPNISQLVAVAVATATYTALSYVALALVPSFSASVGTIFFPIAFGLPFALWFGGWAFVIAYIGNVVGAGVMLGTPLNVALPFGISDFIQLALPMILYRLFATRFGVSAIGKDVFTLRGFLFFLVCAVIPCNILGGLYGNFILVTLAGTNPNLFLFNWFVWATSNIILLIVIGSVFLATVGPIVERYGLTIRDALR